MNMTSRCGFRRSQKSILHLQVLGAPSGRLSRVAHDFSGHLAARHAGTVAVAPSGNHARNRRPKSSDRAGESGVSGYRRDRPRDRISRRSSRAARKADSGGARPRRRLERRGVRNHRNAAADQEPRCRSRQVAEIAAGLGADVPFFLFGGRALAVNRGDEIYPLPDVARRAVLVVSPRDIGVSTKDAYQWLSAELTNRAEHPNIWGFCALCWSRQGKVSNDFEGPVFRRHPRLGEIRDGLLKRGAADAALAGSGSAVFGIFRNPAQARRAARAFPEDSVFVAKTLSREEYGRALGWRASG